MALRALAEATATATAAPSAPVATPTAAATATTAAATDSAPPGPAATAVVRLPCLVLYDGATRVAVRNTACRPRVVRVIGRQRREDG